MQTVALVYIKDDYSINKELQLKAIKESDFPDFEYEIDGESDLKEAYETALSRDVDSIITVLPEKLLESSTLNNYKDKFKSFEVIKETYYRLNEADNTNGVNGYSVQSKQQQTIQPNYKKPAFGPNARNVLIWPLNPPFVTDASKKNFQAIFPYLGKMFTEELIFVFVPQNGVNGNWCLNAPNICARIEDFKQLSTKLQFNKYKIITSVKTFVQNIQQLKLNPENDFSQSAEQVSTNAAVNTTLNNINIYCQPMYAQLFIAAGFNHVYTSIGQTPLYDDDLTASKKVYNDWIEFEKKHQLSKTGKHDAKSAEQNANAEQNAAASAKPELKESLFESILKEADNQTDEQEDSSASTPWEWDKIKNMKGAVLFLTEILSNISTCAKGLGESMMDATKAGGFLRKMRDQYLKDITDVATEAGNFAARTLGLGWMANIASKAAKAYAETDKGRNDKNEISAIGAFIKSKDSDTLRSILEAPEKYIEKAGEGE